MRADLRISVVILNWNNWRATLEAIESVYRSNFDNYDVIVVDNNSTDNSVEMIKRYARGEIRVSSEYLKDNPYTKPLLVFQLSERDAEEGRFNRPLYEKIDPDRRLILIENTRNYGFGGGNNVGIKFALAVLNADYVLLLNNDALVMPETILKLVETAEALKSGAVAPKILWARNPELIDSAGGEYSKNGYSFDRGKFRPLTEFPKREEVSALCAACALYSSRALLEAGLFNDELFFLYYEDTDLASRIRWAGFKLIYEPSATAYHYGGKSTGGLEVSDISVSHSLRGHLVCAVLNLPLKYAPLYTLGNVLYATYNAVRRGKVGAVAKGYRMLLRVLPKAIRGRRLVKRRITEGEFSKLLTLKWRAF